MKKSFRIVRCAVVILMAAMSLSKAQVSVSLPTTGGLPGASVDIPVSIGSVTGLGVTAFQFVLTYDTAIVKITGIDGSGTLSVDFTSVPNTIYPGQLRVASAGIIPIVGSGTLLVIKAQLKNAGTSSLTFTDFRFNEGSPVASVVNGKVTVQKVNHAPLLLSGPGLLVVVLNQPVTFKVRAYDPDGDTLTYTWKQDGIVVKAGKDSSYTTTFGGKYGDPHLVMCIVSDPGGLHADTTWNFTLTPVESIEGSIPGQFALSQNYPNPFNPSTRIEFDLPVTRVVSLEVFDVAGIRIRILLENQRADAGRHEVVWNGLDGNGKQVPSGIYLYRLRTADRSFVRKMTLLK